MQEYGCNSSHTFSKPIKMGMDRKTDTFFAHSNKTDYKNTTFFLITVGLNYGLKKDI